MAVTIEIYVTVNVVDKVAQTLVGMLRVIERLEKPPEHIRDDVFTAVKECRYDLLRPASSGYCHGMRNETLNVLCGTAPRRGYVDRGTGSDHGPKAIELDSAGADVLHRDGLRKSHRGRGPSPRR
jgi:hypothetical protein